MWLSNLRAHAYCALLRLAATLLLVGLAGCGFRPLYSTTAAEDVTTQATYAAIQVAPIPKRSGQLVRQGLRNAFNPQKLRVASQYRLEVDLAQRVEGLAIQANDNITRRNLNMRAAYRLYDRAQNRIILSGTASTLASFNVIREEYANLISQQDAARRSADDIVRQIVARVAVYFNSR